MSKQTDSWSKESGYIWALLGSAVGFANILSFSAQCYRNGGGAFLIPFIVAMLVLGIPMLFLEGIIGKTYHLPMVSSYGKAFGSVGKFFGWLAVTACLTIGSFYTVLTGYSVAYAYFMAVDAVPWNSAEFFKADFLHDSASLSVFGNFSWPIFLATAVVTLFSWYVIVRKISSGIERLCSIFLPLLSFLILFFTFITVFLPGSMIGFKAFLTPNFDKLTDVTLWRDVFGHVFFSFSLGIGIITGYSRHTKKTMSIRRAMIWVAVGDFLISFVSGLAIFGCVGYLSHITKTPFDQIVQADSIFEMGFIIFPMILQTFGPILSSIVGPIFFFCVFIAGVTGVFSIVESVAGNIEVEFGKTRKFAVTTTILLMFLLGSIFAFGNGQHILGALSPMVLGNNYLLGGIAEIIIFMYVCKTIRSSDIWRKNGKTIWPYYALRNVVPVILLAILFFAGKQEFESGFNAPEAVRWGWFGGACLVALVLCRKKTPNIEKYEQEA